MPEQPSSPSTYSPRSGPDGAGPGDHEEPLGRGRWAGDLVASA